MEGDILWGLFACAVKIDVYGVGLGFFPLWCVERSHPTIYKTSKRVLI
jgi:hypothetical protein